MAPPCGRRLRPTRMRGAHQRAGHAVGTGRRARLAAAGADAVLLPKVESPAQLDALARALTRPARPPTFPCGPCAKRRWAFCVWTPSPSSRLAALVVGTSDLVRICMRATPGREETLLARSLAIMAARAHGLAALDGVHLDLDDDAGLALACEQGRNQGFDGKTLIHPRQIAAANAAYAPSPGRSPSRASGCRPGAMPRPAARASRWSTVRWWKTCTRAKPNACWRWPLPSPPPEARRALALIHTAAPALQRHCHAGPVQYGSSRARRRAARRQALACRSARGLRTPGRNPTPFIPPRAPCRARRSTRPAPFPLRP